VDVPAGALRTSLLGSGPVFPVQLQGELDLKLLMMSAAQLGMTASLPASLS